MSISSVSGLSSASMARQMPSQPLASQSSAPQTQEATDPHHHHHNGGGTTATAQGTGANGSGAATGGGSTGINTLA